MNYLFLTGLILASSLNAGASEQWIDGNTDVVFELENRTGELAQFSLLPVSGLNNAPLLDMSDTFLSSSEFVDELAANIPRGLEMATLLKFEEKEFSESVFYTVKFGLKNGIFLKKDFKLSTKQKNAWEVVNKNKKEDMILKVQVSGTYRVVDFEVSGGQGEGGEWRSFCGAGFKQRFEFKIVGIEFPNSPTLTQQGKGIIGTIFAPRHDSFGPSRTFLEMKIDMNQAEAKVFEKECKAQKALL